jgi:TIR domain
MPFSWRDHDGKPLEQRFDEETPGFQAWSAFLAAIPRFEMPDIDRETVELAAGLPSIFWGFVEAIDQTSPADAAKMRHSRPIVFMSHQRSDAGWAERIAELACEHGLDYWLDIHDPVLMLANQNIPPTDLRYPVIIAAIIEMALLNATYLIAVHSDKSLASKWVPYELGRVRDRRIQSRNVGGWFHPAIRPRDCGDYVHLCGIARGGETTVRSWLRNWSAGRFSRLPWPAKSAHQPNPTAPLPIK